MSDDKIKVKNKSATVDILQPGDKYFNGKGIKEVPKQNILIYCRLCNYYEALPTRLGREAMEEARERHAKNKHATDLQMGRLKL